MTNNEQTNTTETKKEEQKTESTNTTTVPPDNTGDPFGSLPMESLIAAPLVAAAQGQQELTSVYLDNLMKLAYTSNSTETQNLDFKYERPVINPDGTVGQTEGAAISAPLLALIPIPAFTMDELDINFDMKVKNTEKSTDQTHPDASATASYNSWFGPDASITGSISSDTEHERQSDGSAANNIQARATQEPPSEGLAKLTSLWAQTKEPTSDEES